MFMHHLTWVWIWVCYIRKKQGRRRNEHWAEVTTGRCGSTATECLSRVKCIVPLVLLISCFPCPLSTVTEWTGVRSWTPREEPSWPLSWRITATNWPAGPVAPCWLGQSTSSWGEEHTGLVCLFIFYFFTFTQNSYNIPSENKLICQFKGNTTQFKNVIYDIPMV